MFRLKEAEQDFNVALEYDRRAHWGLLLIQMIKGDISMRPTYFEVRNFLEMDLSILILYGKSKYIEQIIRYADFFPIGETEVMIQKIKTMVEKGYSVMIFPPPSSLIAFAP